MAELNIIDDSAPGKPRWPGDIKLMEPDAGGQYVIGYQRQETPDKTGNRVFFQDIVDPLSDRSSEFEATKGHNGVDPAVLRLNDGMVIGLWQGDPGCTYVVRSAAGKYSDPVTLFEDGKGYNRLEYTARRAGGKAWVLYDRKLVTQRAKIWDLILRNIGPGPVAGPPILVAKDAVGTGAAGDQTRATITSTGDANKLMVAWAQNADGGSRPIRRALSYDNGKTWKPEDQKEIASWSGHDLVNPFTIYLNRGQLRVYFYTKDTRTGYAYVESTDQGETFNDLVEVDVPLGANTIRACLVRGQQGVYCLCGANHSTQIACFLLLAV